MQHTGIGVYGRSASPIFIAEKENEMERSDSGTDCSNAVFFCHFVPCLKLDEWLTKKQKPSVFLVRSVAQSGSAPASGAGGRRFESSHSDHSYQALRPSNEKAAGNARAASTALMISPGMNGSRPLVSETVTADVASMPFKIPSQAASHMRPGM